MPLVILCGHPASGKSTVASKLAESFTTLGFATTVVDEPSLHLERNASYQGIIRLNSFPDRYDATYGITKCFLVYLGL